jgi:hypothetical protein
MPIDYLQIKDLEKYRTCELKILIAGNGASSVGLIIASEVKFKILRMKKLFILTSLLFTHNLFSQETAPQPVKDTAWKVSGIIGLSASQTELSDWQGGGQSNVALNGVFNVEAIYKRDKFESWTNKIDAQYGIVKPGGIHFRKNIDQLIFLTKYDTKAFGNSWFWAAQADYRSQFSPGYNYSGDSTVGKALSDLNSPGYIQFALGLDYKPTDYFSVFVAPVAGTVTLVNRQYLADEGAYGVDKAIYDDTGVRVKAGKKCGMN